MEMGGGTTSPVRHGSVSVYTDEKLIEEISDGTVSPVRMGGAVASGDGREVSPTDSGACQCPPAPKDRRTKAQKDHGISAPRRKKCEQCKAKARAARALYKKRKDHTQDPDPERVKRREAAPPRRSKRRSTWNDTARQSGWPEFKEESSSEEESDQRGDSVGGEVVSVLASQPREQPGDEPQLNQEEPPDAARPMCVECRNKPVFGGAHDQFCSKRCARAAGALGVPRSRSQLQFPEQDQVGSSPFAAFDRPESEPARRDIESPGRQLLHEQLQRQLVVQGASSYRRGYLCWVGDFIDEKAVKWGSPLDHTVVSVVYQGEWQKRAVAIKTLRGVNELSDERAKRLFYKELQANQACQHENILKLFGFNDKRSTPDGSWFLVAPLMDCALSDVVHQWSGAPPGAASAEFEPLSEQGWNDLKMAVTTSIVSALAHIESMGYAHRDVKSSNVLLKKLERSTAAAAAPQTQSIISVKLCDLGLARVCQSEGGTQEGVRTQGTPGGRGYGTRLYQAPVKKRHFLRHMCIKCIFLPRQARDRHRESSKKEWRFLRRL
jgi:hypothetical protein